MKIRPMEISTMTRRMADLLKGGLPLTKSVAVLSLQSENEWVRATLKSIHGELGNGKSLYEALRSQNGTFDSIYVGLVRAGESSGNLEETLEELSGLLESEVEARQQIRSSMAYPVALFALSICVCVFLAVFVIPRFELLFQDLGQALPWPTRLLLGATSFFRTFGPFILMLVAGVGFWARKKINLQNKIEFSLRKVPVLFDVARTTALHRWTRVMASLLKGGITLPDALRLSRAALPPILFDGVIENLISRLHDGQSLSVAMAQNSIFPPMLCELIGAGEESGRLELTFERLASTYKRESEHKIKFLLSLLEPLLVVFMGLMVGFVALAMLLPIFSLSGNIR